MTLRLASYRICPPGDSIGQEVACAAAGRKFAHGVAKCLLGILELPLFLAQLPDLHAMLDMLVHPSHRLHCLSAELLYIHPQLEKPFLPCPAPLGLAACW